MIVTAIVVLFLAIALVAALFVAWPIFRIRNDSGRASLVLASALTLLVLAIGCGSYLMLGRPALAMRTLEGSRTTDLNGLIGLLVEHLRRLPFDARGWTMLGRAYLTVGDYDDASKALARAVQIAKMQGSATPELLSAFGESLVQDAGGAVPPEAEAAFKSALALDPKDPASRFYLGLAYASHGQNAQALALWKSLLDDSPPNAPWRHELADRVAALSAATGNGPDIGAMVQGLADRLKTNPDDPEGWAKLVRAYSVLGEDVKAKEALGNARIALAKNHDALKALDAEASELKLN